MFGDFSPGGIERVVTYFMRLFIEMGYRVVALTDLPPHEGEFALDFDCERLVIGVPGNVNRPKRLQKAIRNQRIDLVVNHSYFARPKFLREDIRAVHALHVPYVIHHHSVFSSMLLRGTRQLDFARHLPVYRQADALIVLSRVNQAFFRAQGCPSVFIPNPLPETASATPDRKLDPERPTVIWIGRFTEGKRPQSALHIFKRVLADCPTARLLMVGPLKGGANTEGAGIRAAVRADPQLRQSVELLGYQSNVFDWFEHSDVFLSTSGFEGDPCVFVEAKAAGVPIVCYDLPYVESVRDRRGVVSVGQEDEESAAAAIVRLLSDNALNQATGAAARAAYLDAAAFDLKAAYADFIRRLENHEPLNQADVTVEDLEIALRTLSTHLDWRFRRFATEAVVKEASLLRQCCTHPIEFLRRVIRHFR